MRIQIAAACAALLATCGIALAAGATPAPKVTAATVAADKVKIAADTSLIGKDRTALTTAQKQIQTDIASKTADTQLLTKNKATIANLEGTLSSDLKSHNYTGAAQVQTQLAAARAANAKVQGDIIRLNGVIKSDQTKINAWNESVILATRQLNLDTTHATADSYYLAISGL